MFFYFKKIASKTLLRTLIFNQNTIMIDIRLSENLELMKTMESNSVDSIYCDILYGTGKKFKDYQDLKPKRDIIEEHYIPRIKEMHRILKDTGSIYLQMDTRINHWMRCIMDDIFGYDMFLNEIIWCYKQRENPNKIGFNSKHDNILLYTKDKNFTFNQIFEEYSPDYLKKNFKLGNDGRMQRKQPNGKGGYYIQYLDKSKGQPVRDWWEFTPLTGKGGEMLGYATQKPKALIERIIKASSNEGDLVADFYGGSFTTAEACKDLNRNFIGCDISEKAVAIGLKRCGLSCS